MDCFYDEPQPYSIVKITPENCKSAAIEVMRKNIKFTNPYEVSNYFFMLYSNQMFKKFDHIFVEMNQKIYYFRNVDEKILRFIDEACTEEWVPPISTIITKKEELYVVLHYFELNAHLAFLPLNNGLFKGCCVTNTDMWKELYWRNEKCVFCTYHQFLDIFTNMDLHENIFEIYNEVTGWKIISNKPPFKPIIGIPNYQISKDGVILNNANKKLKTIGSLDRRSVNLLIDGVKTEYYVKDLMETTFHPLGYTKEKEHLFIKEAVKNGTNKYSNQTEEVLDSFVTLFTEETWFEQVSNIIDSDHETKKAFFTFLTKFSQRDPLSNTFTNLEAALNTTKYDPLISLLDAEAVPAQKLVVYNIFDHV